MDALAALALAVLTRGGPDPAPPVDQAAAPIEIVIYDDDPIRGAEECRIELSYDSAAVCRVEPTSAAPDITQPGWAWDFAPPWARHMDPRGGG